MAFMYQNVNFAMSALRQRYPEFKGAESHRKPYLWCTRSSISHREVEIINNNLGSILEAIWNIIDVSEIQTVQFGGLVGQEALLHWTQQQTEPYEIMVTDFEKSFAYGYVFCALAHAQVPSTFEYVSYAPVSALPPQSSRSAFL